jgi:hypothetical protein
MEKVPIRSGQRGTLLPGSIFLGYIDSRLSFTNSDKKGVIGRNPLSGLHNINSSKLVKIV